MRIQRELFGTLSDGRKADLFTLSNDRGMVAKISNYGGIIKELHVPDASGQTADVVLGKDKLADYEAGHPFFGCITGRVAGRIRNGRFSLDGHDHELEVNDPPNALHGSTQGFHRQLWEASIVEKSDRSELRLAYTEPSGKCGFPGNLSCVVSYTLHEDNRLEITYQAETDARTPLNLTNHSYFNLSGHDSGDILKHRVQIHSDSVASVESNATLTGHREPLSVGYNDFREACVLADLETLDIGNADIHHFMPEGRTAKPHRVARIEDRQSGRMMEVFTTEPGMQFYAGLFLNKKGLMPGKSGSVYKTYQGLCLETQAFADSANHPDMGGTLLCPDEIFQSATVYRFDTQL